MKEHDLLNGGEHTTAINVDYFYQYWMNTQKNNVYLPKVKEYKDKILRQENIEAPILGDIEFMDEDIAIRTADGRHRLAGAKLAGIPVVFVRMSEQLKSELEMLLPGLIISENNQEENKENTSGLTQNVPYVVKLLAKNTHLLVCKLRFLANNLPSLTLFA